MQRLFELPFDKSYFLMSWLQISGTECLGRKIELRVKHSKRRFRLNLEI